MGSPNSGAARAAQKEENLRQQRIRAGLANIGAQFEGFTPAFYNKRAEAYNAFALPQLAYQQGNANRQLTFGLANRGLLGSSSAREQQTGLERAGSAARQAIVAQGRSQANELQRQVEQTRSDITGQLYQSADPSQAQQRAIGLTASLSAPSVFAPIANAFGDFTNSYLSNQLIQAYKQGAAAYKQPTGNAGALPSAPKG